MSTIVIFIFNDIDNGSDYDNHIKILEHLIMEDTFMYLIDIDTLQAWVSRNIVGTGLGISRNSAGPVIWSEYYFLMSVHNVFARTAVLMAGADTWLFRGYSWQFRDIIRKYDRPPGAPI